jgi:hypothetical protein
MVNALRPYRLPAFRLPSLRKVRLHLQRVFPLFASELVQIRILDGRTLQPFLYSAMPFPTNAAELKVNYTLFNVRLNTPEVRSIFLRSECRANRFWDLRVVTLRRRPSRVNLTK